MMIPTVYTVTICRHVLYVLHIGPFAAFILRSEPRLKLRLVAATMELQRFNTKTCSLLRTSILLAV
jgi:hypothetical protein